MSNIKWCLYNPGSELRYMFSFNWLIYQGLFVRADWKVRLHMFLFPDLFDSAPDKHWRQGSCLPCYITACEILLPLGKRGHNCRFWVWLPFCAKLFSLWHMHTIQKWKKKILTGIWKSAHPLADSSELLFEKCMCFAIHCSRKTVFTKSSSRFLDRHNTP